MKKKKHAYFYSDLVCFQISLECIVKRGCACKIYLLNKWPMGHIAHLRKHIKSINTYDYHNVNLENKNPIIYFMRIEWFFIWTNLNLLHPRELCTKFGWNSPSGTGEEGFSISLMYFRFLVIISPWKVTGLLSLEHTWIPFTQGCIVPSLVEIGPVVLEKRMF